MFCECCGKEKDKSLFFNDNSKLLGKRKKCKECNSKDILEYKRSKEGLVTVIYSSQIKNAKDRGMNIPTYSKEWLKNWLFINPMFHRLYDTWVLNNYEKTLKPSIDRKNDYISYTEYNIELMTWGENCNKLYKDKKDGVNNKSSVAVVKINTDNTIEQIYYSVSIASRENEIIRQNIIRACNKNIKAGGFYWKYYKDLK